MNDPSLESARNDSPVARRTLAVCAAAVTAASVTGCDDRPPRIFVEPAQAVVAAAQVPVGGGLIVPESGVVIAQPEVGVYRAFSARCTHSGCTVNRVVNAVIECPCHGSRFRIDDGTPVQGPATKPLEPRQVTVQADQLHIS